MIRPSPFADADVVKNGSAEVTAIDDLSNVTIFLPVNYAFKEIGSVVKNWTIKDLQRVMSYHIINDVLPPDSNGRLPLGQYTALDGSKVSIADYEGDQFINNARIVGEYNWVFRGGLIYTIFGVLNPDNTTVTPSISDSGIAFADASFTTDLAFPTSLSDGTGSGSAGTSSGGLPTGAKAAIGIGAAAFVLIASLLGFWLFYRRKMETSPKPYESEYQLSDVNMSQKNLTPQQGGDLGLDSRGH